MSRRRTVIRRISRVLMFAVLIAFGWLLVRHARSVEWDEVFAVLTGYPLGLLLGAGALATVSYLLFCGYDLAARRYSGHCLHASRVMAISFVSYVVSLNLGALVGGGGIRFRLYSHAGLPLRVISRIVGFSVFTNWLGYFVLAGLLLALDLLAWPADWPVAAHWMRGIGVLLLLTAAAYLVACSLHHGRPWRLRGHTLDLPPLPLALLQTLLSCLNWLVIAAMPYWLLHQQVEYTTVLGVLMLGGIVSAAVHIPGGLGVLEGVFVMMLGAQLDTSEILGALLAYRGIYYLAPLLPALLLFLYLEAHQLRHVRRLASAASGAAASR